jgi:hypothetical protein
LTHLLVLSSCIYGSRQSSSAVHCQRLQWKILGPRMAPAGPVSDRCDTCDMCCRILRAYASMTCASLNPFRNIQQVLWPYRDGAVAPLVVTDIR